MAIYKGDELPEPKSMLEVVYFTILLHNLCSCRLLFYLFSLFQATAEANNLSGKMKDDFFDRVTVLTLICNLFI